MPNPTRISLPRVNYNFDAKACVPVLTVMLNKVEKDYSTVDELCDHDELSKFTRDEIKNAVSELNGRKFLLKVDKPYGCVYAVNKLYIANMEFVYGRYWDAISILTERKKRCIIYTMGFVYPFDVFKL